MFGGYSPYSGLGLGSLAKPGINWSALLTNTGKTLGVINQAIPAFYQIKPVYNNVKTMFRVVKEINKPATNNSVSNNISTKNNIDNKEKETNTNINFFA